VTLTSRADGFDAVVVGSGPNGLIGAVTLARAGLKVLLLEAADDFGGGLRSGPLTGLDEFTHDLCATVLPLARASAAFRDLDLDVEWAFPSVQAAHPLDGQDAVLVHRDVAATADGLGSRRDAAAWRQSVGAAAAGGFGLVDTLLSPLSVPRAPLRLARYGALGGLPATLLGRALFTGERGRAVLAGMAAHSMVDLRRPITGGYGLLLAALAHQVGWPVVRGGSARLAAALVGRLIAHGGVAETGRPVRDLADVPAAEVILLDVSPRQLLALGGARLPAGYARRLGNYRYGPGVFKLDWALSGPVPWRDPAVAGAATVHLGGTLDQITSAEGEVAAGRHPERPYVLAVQPGAADPSRAPAGKHVLWAYCHVPNGSTRDMTAAVENQVERFAPGFRDLILARAAHDTAALERHNRNLVGGDIAGGYSGLAQFVRRPVLAARPWRTPLPGVYLCSASTPPGAGVHGMGGYHAARLALADLRRALPVAVPDYLVERQATRLDDGLERTVGGVAHADQVGDVVVVGDAEDLAGLLLVADRGVAGADAQVRRGQHDRVGGLAEVVLVHHLGALVLGVREDERDRRGGARDVPRALPDRRQRLELLRVGDDDEVPVLPVARRRGPPAGLGDPVEIGGGNGVLRVRAHVPPGADGVPGLHVSSFAASMPIDPIGIPHHGLVGPPGDFCGLTTINASDGRDQLRLITATYPPYLQGLPPATGNN
jgi:phytoene dehydrogenase-like protein